jgi:hypothetical protein
MGMDSMQTWAQRYSNGRSIDRFGFWLLVENREHFPPDLQLTMRVEKHSMAGT